MDSNNSNNNLTPCKRKVGHDDDEVDVVSTAASDSSQEHPQQNEGITTNKRARSSPDAAFISSAIARATNISSSVSNNSLSSTAGVLTGEGSGLRNSILRRVISGSQRYLAESTTTTTSASIPSPPVAAAVAIQQQQIHPHHPVPPKKNEFAPIDDSSFLDQKMPAVDTHSASGSVGEATSNTTNRGPVMPPFGLGQDAAVDDAEALGDIDAVDGVFRKVAALTFAVWVVLVTGVATTFRFDDEEEKPSNDSIDYIYYDTMERRVPQTAFFILLVGFILQLSPLFVTRIKTLTGVAGPADAPQAMSGVILSAIVIQSISLTTNFVLGWGPRMVVTDPMTGSRVFLMRWCEWIPLSGFMTLLAESADIPVHKHAWRKPMIFSLSQSLSTLCGMVLPYCQSSTQWCLVMFISCLTFIPVFPRVWYRRHLLLRTARGNTVLEREYYDRRRFAYYLMVMCSICWSVLVSLYFVNMVIHMTTAPNHWLRFPSLAMSCDTIADVMAKVVYTRIIVDAHQAVFASDLRTVRQLNELKQLMSMLWVSSSDVIVISTKQTKHRNATMLSPSFLTLVGASFPLAKKAADTEQDKTTNDASWETSSKSFIPNDLARQSVALVLETDRGKIKSAYYVDTATVSGDPHPGRLDHQRVFLAHEDLQHNAVLQALRITNTAWTTRNCNYTDGDQQEPLRALSIVHCDPSRAGKVMCEMKVSRHTQQTAVAVVRDVTERYRRFEAESRAHAETIARQRDMHTANRFTRHEVKNGLLSGIELCRTLGQSLNELQSMLGENGTFTPAKQLEVNKLKSKLAESAKHVNLKTLKSLVDLDGTLRGVLDTVLAEVMAREVVHEVYQPRLEELDVPSMLVSNLGMSKDRIPVTIKGRTMPKLLLDAQLIGHIHRNAVSNACKYGKQGGKVHTTVQFDAKKQEFRMSVTNEPGAHHATLLALGDSASEFVFAQGVRLQPHMKGKTEKKLDSSGDGAWIMQKCAKTMNGACNISFTQNQTQFTFHCPAVPVTQTSSQPDYKNFVVPSHVFGIGVDDSKIQRKLLSRILAHAGVDPSRQILLGESQDDITELESTVMNLMDENPDKKFLVIVDEHLVSSTRFVIKSNTVSVSCSHTRSSP